MAMRPSFRPRPIDSSKPLPIVRTSKDLRHEDDVVVSRALPSLGTGVEAAELEERHLQQALLASVYGDDANKADIPIPVFQNVSPPRPKNISPFERPRGHYILFDRSDADLEDSFVDYDADHIDEEFVEKYNAAHKKSAVALSMDSLERTMDCLEKLQGRALAEEEDDVDIVAESRDTKKGAAVSAAAAAKPSLTRESVVQFSHVRQELVALLPNCSDAGRREIYSHWVERRLAKGTAFHRLYAKPPAPDDPNPGVAFRPRGREDGGGGRRMNTYDNYKRAVLLREEFDILRSVMESVVSRERVKAEQVILAALRMRVKCVSLGGARLAAVSRTIVANEREGFSFGTGDSRLLVSCRGLPAELPAEVESVVSRGPFGSERVKAKKSQRKRTPTERASARTEARAGLSSSAIGIGSTASAGGNGDRARDAVGDSRETRQAASSVAQQNGVDSYGYDEHGNRFLKHMRYFAGGFMNYGVSPYDHRVFAAASERNTVKDLPTDPKPFLFPEKSLPFASRVHATGGKWGPQMMAGDQNGPKTSSRTENGARTEKVVGKVSTVGPNFGAGVSKRKRRPVKVRARVGRGGRVVLDRVVFEPDKGVKAASYPASVEMGGVYTGGMPLEAAPGIASAKPDLIHLEDLGMPNCFSSEERALVEPLQPMIAVAPGSRTEDGRTVYWPSRKSALGSGKDTLCRGRSSSVLASDELGTPNAWGDSQNRMEMSDKGGCEESPWHLNHQGDNLRKMPAYAPRDGPLVQLVGDDAIVQ